MSVHARWHDPECARRLPLFGLVIEACLIHDEVMSGETQISISLKKKGRPEERPLVS
jgi:hypothetical protein